MPAHQIALGVRQSMESGLVEGEEERRRGGEEYHALRSLHTNGYANWSIVTDAPDASRNGVGHTTRDHT